MAKAALLIGVGTYESGFNPLPAATRDVQAIKQVLQNPQIGGFDELDIRTLENPDPQRMREEIESLFADRQKDDLLLLYFSGHGVKDDSGSFYLTNFRTRKNRLNSTAISSDEIHRLMEASRSKYQVVILDCCFSGAFATGMTAKADGVNVSEQLNQLGGQGRAVLTSSSAVEYSFEQKEMDLSVYTHYLVEGLATGAADIGGDGRIAIDELHEYVSGKVREASPAMKPGIYAAREGYNIVLARATTDDPKLGYRRKVEHLAKQREIYFVSRNLLDDVRGRLKLPPKPDVAISAVGRGILDASRDSLELSPEVANAIEVEVLKPRREFEQKRQRYKQVLIQATQRGKLPSQSTRESLRHLQQILGLRGEDIADIEAQVAQRTRQVARSSIKPVSNSSSNLLVLLGGTAVAVLTGVLVFAFSRHILSGNQIPSSVTSSPSESSSVIPDASDSTSSNSSPIPSPSNTPESQTRETDLLQQANEKAAKGDYSGAVEDYGQVIQINNNNAIAYSGRGNAYYSLSEYQKAIDDYNRAFERGLKDAVLHMNRGNAYAALANEPANQQISQAIRDKAFDDYTEAIKLSSDNPDPIAYMGRGHVGRFKDKTGAIEDYEEAKKWYKKRGQTEQYRQARDVVDQLKRGER